MATLTRVCRAIMARTAGKSASAASSSASAAGSSASAASGPAHPAGASAASAGLRLAAVRGLIGSAASGDELTELQEWLRAERVPDGPGLDPELRWSILLRLSAAGAVDGAEIDAELTRDPSATGQVNAARCRAARPDPEAKEAAWRLLFSETGRSKRLLGAVASGFWQPDQSDLLSGYVGRYFAEIPAVAAQGPSAALTLGKALFPAYAATPDTVALAEKCLAREGLAPPLRRALSDQLDDLRRVLRVQADDDG